MHRAPQLRNIGHIYIQIKGKILYIFKRKCALKNKTLKDLTFFNNL